MVETGKKEMSPYLRTGFLKENISFAEFSGLKILGPIRTFSNLRKNYVNICH